MAILLPLMAAALVLSRTDLLIGDNLKGGVQAFYIAEAGIHHALNSVPPGKNFESVLSGPDGRPETSDDGQIFSEPTFFPDIPFHYTVRASRISDTTIRITSTGFGPRGSARRIAVTLARAKDPYIPGALYLPGATEVRLGEEPFLISGFDHRIADTPSEPKGSSQPVPGIAVPDREFVQRARSLLEPYGENITGDGGPPSVQFRNPLPLSDIREDLSQHPQTSRFTEPNLSGQYSFGTSSEPAITHAPGDLYIEGEVSSNGILFVEGNLSISGSLLHDGLLVVAGDVRVERQGTATIYGSLWMDEMSRLDFSGATSLLYSSEAIATVEEHFPSLLPKETVILAWQEIF